MQGTSDKEKANICVRVLMDMKTAARRMVQMKTAAGRLVPSVPCLLLVGKATDLPTWEEYQSSKMSCFRKSRQQFTKTMHGFATCFYRDCDANINFCLQQNPCFMMS
jgi:hypothetical protein